MDKIDLWINRIVFLLVGVFLGLVIAFLKVDYGWWS
jgi:uncharacterized membrane-anchored protein YhcB (DUF1043 family)